MIKTSHMYILIKTTHPNKLCCFEKFVFVGTLWMKKEYGSKLCVFTMGIHKHSTAFWLSIARVASNKKFGIQPKYSTCARLDI